MTMADLERRPAAARSQLEALHAIDRAALASGGPRELRHVRAGPRPGPRPRTASAPGASRSRATAASTPGSRGSPRRCRSRPSKDYEDYLSRLRAIPAYFDQHVALMREGLRTGFTSPRVALEGYDATMRPHVVSDAGEERLLEAVRGLPPGVPAAEAERLRAAGREAIDAGVVPAYRSLLEFFTGVPARCADDDRGLGAARRARPTTRGS